VAVIAESLYRPVCSSIFRRLSLRDDFIPGLSRGSNPRLQIGSPYRDRSAAELTIAAEI
jgi:hypothetical protein